ncbi:MAG TPA: hypothetical protein VMS54_10845 [Vicinamibacterales bacterium]|nr:hypothetical protein [Vicinamibacterales bacterium]
MRIILPVAIATILAISLVDPASASAQTPPDRSRVDASIGSNVEVTTRDGGVYTGKLVLTSPAEITLVDGGRQIRVPFAEIRQVERRHHTVRKSTLVGLGIGLGFGVVSLATGGCTEDAGTFALECMLEFAGIGAGAGALTGLMLRRSDVVYRATQGPVLKLTPVLSGRRAGLFGTIRW